MKNATKGKLIKAGAIGLDVAAPLITTLSMFPIWVERSSEATVSGLFLVFAFLSCIPFAKWLLAYFKSPDAWVMWCIVFVLLSVLSNIIKEMLVVAGVGALANVTGAVIYKIGDVVSAKPDPVPSADAADVNDPGAGGGLNG